jgi:multisubunit Na+/H+ antiporter MnhC subunit
MAKNSIASANVFAILCVFLTGIGVGWLLGLSASPVVSIVITSVTGSAAAIVAALSGLNKEAKEANTEGQRRLAIDPLPLAALVIGIVFGSIVGISARNHHWFGSDRSSEIEQWTKLGLVKEMVVSRLFEQLYPANGAQAGTKSSTGNPLGTFLFAVDVQKCDALLAGAAIFRATADQAPLILALKSDPDPKIRQLPEVVADPQILQNIVEKILCVDGEPSQ